MTPRSCALSLIILPPKGGLYGKGTDQAQGGPEHPPGLRDVLPCAKNGVTRAKGGPSRYEVDNLSRANPLVISRECRSAHAERFVRTIKESCLERIIRFGEGSLRKAVHEFVEPYHRERNHQGLDNRLIIQEQLVADRAAAIQRRSRWGGMLNYYYRQAA